MSDMIGNFEHGFIPHDVECLQMGNRIKELEVQLEQANKGYTWASVAFEKSQKKIEELEKQLEKAKSESEEIKKYDKECVKKCDLIIQRTIERKKEISDLERDNQELKDILDVKDGELTRLRKENETIKSFLNEDAEDNLNEVIHLRTLLERAKEIVKPFADCMISNNKLSRNKKEDLTFENFEKARQLLKDMEGVI